MLLDKKYEQASQFTKKLKMNINKSTVEDVLIHSDLKILLKNMLNIAQTMKQSELSIQNQKKDLMQIF